MGSSPGFVSNPSDSVALFRLAFATAPSVSDLTLPLRLTRWLILQKARRHTLRLSAIVLRPVVSTRFQVLFHSPYRGSFHLSFTVLVHYRSSNVFSLGKWASQIPTGLACPAVLRIHRESLSRFRLRDCHPLWSNFPESSTTRQISYSHMRVLQPRCHIDNGLGFSPFARHYSGNNLFS